VYEFKPLNERVEVFQRPFRIVQDLAIDATPQGQAALKDSPGTHGPSGNARGKVTSGGALDCSVPSSKIYLAMEKHAGLGLVQVQPTHPTRRPPNH
jgi:hypothetical protein